MAPTKTRMNDPKDIDAKIKEMQEKFNAQNRRNGDDVTAPFREVSAEDDFPADLVARVLDEYAAEFPDRLVVEWNAAGKGADARWLATHELITVCLESQASDLTTITNQFGSPFLVALTPIFDPTDTARMFQDLRKDGLTTFAPRPLDCRNVPRRAVLFIDADQRTAETLEDTLKRIFADVIVIRNCTGTTPAVAALAVQVTHQDILENSHYLSKSRAFVQSAIGLVERWIGSITSRRDAE